MSRKQRYCGTRKLIIAAVSPCLFVLNGCAALSLLTCSLTLGFMELPQQGSDVDPRGHYIIVHREGGPADHRGRKIEAGVEEEYPRFVSEYVDKIRDGFDLYAKWHNKLHKETAEPARLLLYVHGGLNNYEDGLERVLDLTYKPHVQDFRLLGLADDTKQQRRAVKSFYYPVFVIWDASFSGAVCDDLFRVRAGYENRGWAIPTAPFILTKRLGEAVSGAFSGLGSMFVDLAEGFDGQNTAGNVTTNIPTLPMRFLAAPMMQAFGSPAWEMLYRRTDFMVTRPVKKADKQAGAVGILMDELICASSEATKCISFDAKKPMWISDEPDKNEPHKKKPMAIPIEMTLAGHSMGTLVLDSLIQEFPLMLFQRIVYLASASSVDDVKSSVIPYLRNNSDSEFYSFTLSRGDEAREIQGWGLVPQGSLLVWIDSFFAGVYTPNHLRFGRRKSLDDVGFKLPLYLQNKKTLIRSFKGKEGEPKQHGDFDEPEILPRILCTVDRLAFSTPCGPYVDVNYYPLY